MKIRRSVNDLNKMNIRLFLAAVVICGSATGDAQMNSAINPVEWRPAEFQLATRWSKEVSPTNALPEYPRPQMVRSEWTNLNGLWSYAITDSTTYRPNNFDGQILVPYPIESALSGVKKVLQPN